MLLQAFARRCASHNSHYCTGSGRRPFVTRVRRKDADWAADVGGSGRQAKAVHDFRIFRMGAIRIEYRIADIETKLIVFRIKRFFQPLKRLRAITLGSVPKGEVRFRNVPALFFAFP